MGGSSFPVPHDMSFVPFQIMEKVGKHGHGDAFMLFKLFLFTENGFPPIAPISPNGSVFIKAYHLSTLSLTVPGKHSENQSLQGKKLLAIYHNRYGAMPCIQLNHILLVTHCDYRISGRAREEWFCVPEEKSPMQRGKETLPGSQRNKKELLLECEKSGNCDFHENK